MTSAHKNRVSWTKHETTELVNQTAQPLVLTRREKTSEIPKTVHLMPMPSSLLTLATHWHLL